MVYDPGAVFDPQRGPMRDQIETAAAHAGMGWGRVRAGRWTFFKRVVLRVARLFAAEQRVFNDAAVLALRQADDQLTALRAQLMAEQTRSATLELELAELRERLDVLASTMTAKASAGGTPGTR